MVKVLIKTVAAAPCPVEVAEQLTGAELYSLVAAHLSLEPDKIKVRPSAPPVAHPPKTSQQLFATIAQSGGRNDVITRKAGKQVLA